jgi:protein required for attachment to host cells
MVGICDSNNLGKARRSGSQENSENYQQQSQEKDNPATGKEHMDGNTHEHAHSHPDNG